MHKDEAVCAKKYENLSSHRTTYLERAREAAKLTIPSLVPEEGHTSSSKLYTPYQGVGARGVNNLASKLLLSLLPPNAPFFAMRLDDFTIQELAQTEGARAKVDEALNKYERAVMTEIENSGMRSPIFEALKQLIVAGNVLLYLPPEGGARVFPLSRYVVKRDPMGEVIEVIVKETMSRATLPEDIQEMLTAKEGDLPSDDNNKKSDEINLYTKMYREGNKYILYQELDGMIVPNSHGKYPLDKAPMLALRWTRIDGEDYGRSYVEEYIGDLISLEGLSKAILEASAVSAKVVFLVAPNGTTRARDISKAENGAIVAGNAAEVSTLQVQKQADMSIASQTASTITERLAYAFLMNSAIQRAGERVTAEEVRYMAGELEDALGGVYSILSQEFQLPLVNRIIARMTKKKKLPSLPKGVANPTIVTGLEALGRGHDMNKYQMFLQALAPLGPEAVGQFMNVNDYITRVGTALGIDMDGLIKSEEQLQQERQQQAQQMQQAQMMEMAKAATGPVAREAAGAARDSVAGNGE
mgnify:FL=1